MSIKIFSPATVANIASGFDSMGLCLSKLGDIITVAKNSAKEISVSSNVDVPKDPYKNTAGRGLLRLIKDKNLEHGFNVHLEKNIPFCSGLGGSASGAVGAIVGANQLLGLSMSKDEILEYALEGEAATGSSHYDNIAPCLYGGVVGVCNNKVIQIENKAQFKILLIHQDIEINTHQSREKLPQSISLQDHIKQTQSLISLISGFKQARLDYITNGLKDYIVEPKRKSLISNFDQLKSIFTPITLGGSISGSGPSVFFFYESKSEALILENLKKINFPISYWLEELNLSGAKEL